MNKPHKHAELIKAWADGAEIQYKSIPDGEWVDDADPTWNAEVFDFRIKPSVEVPAGFIPWQGGDCPVDGGCFVEITTRLGSTNKENARIFRWSHWHCSDDIIAYRVVKTAPVVRWQWIRKEWDAHTKKFVHSLTVVFLSKEEADREYPTTAIAPADWTRMEFDE